MPMRGPIHQNPLTLDQLLPFPIQLLCQQVLYIVISHPSSLNIQLEGPAKVIEHAWKKKLGSGKQSMMEEWAFLIQILDKKRRSFFYKKINFIYSLIYFFIII